MFSLKRRARKPDPAPSRWSWRLQRLMLTPGFRLALRAGLPFCAALAFGTWYLTDEDRRGAIVQVVADARDSVETRPEFMVQLMAIDGVGPAQAAQIRTAVPLEFPLSSFDLDLAHIRTAITDIPTIRNASVRIRPGGVLQIDAEPRVPVVVWRHENGLHLLDEAGVFVAEISRRNVRADLPLIAGEGAYEHVSKALELVDAAAPLGARLRGVVRIGDRRWDVVLDRDQRILLPEIGARRALERVMALEGAQEVLTRDVIRVDMRLPQRPTVQMNTGARDEWRAAQELSEAINE